MSDEYTPDQLNAVIRDHGDTIAALSILGLAKALAESGLKGTSAVRQAAVMLIDETFGHQAIRDLGIPPRTRERWYSEVRAGSLRELPDTPPAEFIQQALSWAETQQRKRAAGE